MDTRIGTFLGRWGLAAALVITSSSCISLAQGFALWNRPDVTAARDDLFRPEFYVDVSKPSWRDMQEHEQRQAMYEAFTRHLAAGEELAPNLIVPPRWLPDAADALPQPQPEDPDRVAVGARGLFTPALDALARPAAPGR